MEIVIDIPEEEYQTYINHTEAILDASIPLVHQDLLRAVINGTPLPKGHGNIVDIEKLIDMFWDGGSMEITKYDLSVIEPLIEADKE